VGTVLGQRFGSGKHLFCLGSYTNIFREVDPADGSRRINQEFCRPRNICLLGAALDVEQVITPDDLGLGIGKEDKAIALLTTEPGRFLRAIDADGHRAHAGIVEFFQILLNAS